jgi:hypothetical protein
VDELTGRDRTLEDAFLALLTADDLEPEVAR